MKSDKAKVLRPGDQLVGQRPGIAVSQRRTDRLRVAPFVRRQAIADRLSGGAGNLLILTSQHRRIMTESSRCDTMGAEMFRESIRMPRTDQQHEFSRSIDPIAKPARFYIASRWQA